MRIPPKNDPHGDVEGSLPLDIIIQVLSENDVEVTPLGDSTYELYGNGELEVQVFPKQVGGLMIRRLAEKYDIYITEFYFDPNTRQPRVKKS